MYLYQFKSLIKKFYLNIIYFYYSFNFTTPKKFIYFASQFQPEATSCPDGGVFNDNVKLLKRIRKYTPKDISIVYKEHPASFNPNPNLNGDISRSFSYYKNLSNIKNLVFAKLNYDSFKLMDKSIFCSTVAGQLGFESTIRNNYCVIFSRAWYKNFPKIIYIDNIKKIKKIFKKINKYQKRKEELEIKNCIHFFLKHSLKTRICNDDYIYEPKDITRVSNYLKKSL